LKRKKVEGESAARGKKMKTKLGEKKTRGYRSIISDWGHISGETTKFWTTKGKGFGRIYFEP